MSRKKNAGCAVRHFRQLGNEIRYFILRFAQNGFNKISINSDNFEVEELTPDVIPLKDRSLGKVVFK